MTFDSFRQALGEFFFFPPAESELWSEMTNLETDLGFDSLDYYELLLFMEIQGDTRISEAAGGGLETLGQVHEWILMADRARASES
jgi:acyl carrier protein